jgi:hypothetical protein
LLREQLPAVRHDESLVDEGKLKDLNGSFAALDEQHADGHKRPLIVEASPPSPNRKSLAVLGTTTAA